VSDYNDPEPAAVAVRTDLPRLQRRSLLPFRPALLAWLAIGLPGGARGDCPTPPAALPAETSTTAPADDSIHVSSEGAEVKPDGTASLSGGVRLVQGARTLTAESADYDASHASVAASGHVRYEDPSLRIAGSAGTYSSDGGGMFSGAEFQLLKTPARGTANEITYLPDGNLELRGVTFSTCPVGKDDWLMRARSIDIDQKSQQGTARDVRLYFEGVPILYTPILSFPVGDARKSGFLFPQLGQSGLNGATLAAPYYLDLAPNYDATLTPGYMSKRGATVGAEFRYLTATSRGALAVDSVPHDATVGTERSFLRFADRTDFTSRLRLDVNLAGVSDSQYFENFGVGPEGTSLTYLERSVRLTYLDAHWRAIALAQQYQTLDLTVPAILRPYARAPEVLVAGRWALPQHFDFSIDAEAVEFVRTESLAGVRARTEPRLSLTWRRPGMYLTPTVGYTGLKYELRDLPTGVAGGPLSTVAVTNRSPGASAPFASLDTGLFLERQGSTQLITLEPRALYTYVPYRDQTGLPIFDTSLPDLNLVQLFRSERFAGGDRITDANQAAIGATSRLVDEASGRQLISATLGQIYYFERPRVALPIIDPVTGQPVAVEPVTSSTSDVVAELSVRAYGHWSVRLGEEWTPHNSQSQLTEVLLQYRQDADRLLNLGYRYRRSLSPLITTLQTGLKQTEASFAWPLTHAINVVGREVYSLIDRGSIESLLGLEFRSCCWRVRFVGRRDIVSRPTDILNRTGNRDTSIALQLELNGLSNVEGGAGSFLERSIRGYSPAAGAALSD
jgi:LPS-assembly protein